jgi:hypothetical protein
MQQSSTWDYLRRFRDLPERTPVLRCKVLSSTESHGTERFSRDPPTRGIPTRGTIGQA